MRFPFRIAAIAIAGSASGCMVMQPSPAVEAVNLFGIVALHTAAAIPGDASSAVRHPHVRPAEICIELNNSVGIADLVPALQSELRNGGISSRVYERGMQPLDCPATLNYSATLAWDKRTFASDYSSYLTAAVFTLRDNGQVLASSTYEANPLGIDKWSTTDRKISGAIKALLTDE